MVSDTKGATITYKLNMRFGNIYLQTIHADTENEISNRATY